jgi:hypothetical protein
VYRLAASILDAGDILVRYDLAIVIPEGGRILLGLEGELALAVADVGATDRDTVVELHVQVPDAVHKVLLLGFTARRGG